MKAVIKVLRISAIMRGRKVEVMVVNGLIHIAMASDDNYAHHLAVAICSILKNLSTDRQLCVYVLHDGLSGGTKTKLEQLKSLRNFDLQYIYVNCDKYSSFKSGHKHISRLGYARFKLPFTLNLLGKCIYLDCDIIVRQDISQLWDIGLPNEAYLGAIEEPYTRFRNQDLGIPNSYSYFNSGVLLLDLEKLREFDLENKAFAYLEDKGYLPYQDQDVLNALFYDKWYPLPIKWNVSSTFYNYAKTNRFYRYSDEAINAVQKDVAIAHFSCPIKPDSYRSISPYKNEYLQYKKYTAWKDSLLKDLNFVSLLLRLYWMMKDLLNKVPILFIFMRVIKRIFTGHYFNKNQSEFNKQQSSH